MKIYILEPQQTGDEYFFVMAQTEIQAVEIFKAHEQAKYCFKNGYLLESYKIRSVSPWKVVKIATA